MKITYEEFERKLKSTIKEDLISHKEKESLEKILDLFYHKTLEKDCGEKQEDFIYGPEDVFYFTNFAINFKNRDYNKALDNFVFIYKSKDPLKYVLIKLCEELFYDK